MKTVSAWSYTLSMKEKEQVSNSDILKDITPQNEIQMWQFLKLCVLLSLARRGTRQSCDSTVFFPPKRKQQQLLCFFSYLLQTKANRKVPLKERASKLQAWVKASADLAFLQVRVCSFPGRTRGWGLRNLTKCHCQSRFPEILAKGPTEERRPRNLGPLSWYSEMLVPRETAGARSHTLTAPDNCGGEKTLRRPRNPHCSSGCYISEPWNVIFMYANPRADKTFHLQNY